MSTSNGKPYHRGDVPAALVRAALDLLQEESVESISLRAVARRAGVSAMAPYRHFADKEALLAAVARLGFAELRNALSAADETASTDGALLAQGIAYVRFAIENETMFRLMFGPPRRGEYPDLTRTSETAFSVLVRRVSMDGADRTRGRAGVLGYWSLVHGLAMLILDGKTSIAGLAILADGDIRAVLATMI